MTVFASDNVTSACPEIMQAINNANKGHVDSYGNDQWSKNLDKKSLNFLRLWGMTSIQQVLLQLFTI